MTTATPARAAAGATGRGRPNPHTQAHTRTEAEAEAHAQVQAQAATLAARTARLPPGFEPDLLAIGGVPGAVVWQRGAAGVAGRGEALRITLQGGLADPGASERVAAVLGAIAVDDEVGRAGCGPVAIGALPFERSAPATLVVPAILAGRAADGTSWITSVGPAGSEVRRSEEAVEAMGALAVLPEMNPPDSFSLASGRPHAEWCALVGHAVAAIRAGRFDKVVLAREVLVEANRQLIAVDVLRRLHALYPSCILFAADGFLGASPELLISRTGPEIASHPLAGTIAHSGDPEADGRAAAGLLASAKERHEHRLVVDAVAAALRPVCDRLDVPETPSIVSLRNVSHLGTLLCGHLAGDPASALDLVAALHPTPAVSGAPNEEALAYLREVEGFDRGRYAGPVGWQDRNGDGAWAVGIRSAELRGHRARLFAGVGVVADSDPAAELAETQLKLQALLAAVVRP
jgi:menaquinone-specific isochorismate synthase